MCATQYTFIQFRKEFVLTCGYVMNCRVWGNKKHRIATMFFVVHILFEILAN